MEYIEKILEACKNHHVIFIYVSKKEEPDTHELIEKLLKEKTVVVPKILENDIVPIRLNSFDELKKGKFNILEPKTDNEFPTEKIDLFIIPGVNFDLKGNRKGHGFGYFDRFLKNIKAKKIGLCFKSQITKLDPKPWDVPMDEVLVVDE